MVVFQESGMLFEFEDRDVFRIEKIDFFKQTAGEGNRIIKKNV